MTDRFEKLTTGVSRIYKKIQKIKKHEIHDQTLINGEICFTLPSMQTALLRNPMWVTCMPLHIPLEGDIIYHMDLLIQ